MLPSHIKALILDMDGVIWRFDACEDFGEIADRCIRAPDDAVHIEDEGFDV